MAEPQPHIILASASPRRRELIARLGVPFTVQPVGVDEDALARVFAGRPEDLALYLARAKAAAVAVDAALRPGTVILTADTTVLLDGVILGKPRDADEARQMLTSLRGRTHRVITGVVVRGLDRQREAAVTTPVTMRTFSDAEMEAYIASGDPFDKAGSYAVQHTSFSPVAQIVGCMTNVIGLPLCATSHLLREAGLALPPPRAHGAPCPWDTRCTQAPPV